ncbi:alpha/beta hydrolase ['Paenibacillus yunnanensis' Narsing Rao et al. 2020]|uniref:alpha/beta hydrolase n=1 Tax=Paenibacillus tengchongensis TaxID=2608684 RepID=UPI00124F54E2|nr:alpha/beta hydrolase [Paenibacillus tengchongensis]
MRTSSAQLQIIKQHLRQIHDHTGKTVGQLRREALEAAKGLPALPEPIFIEPAQIGSLSGEWVYAGAGCRPGEHKQAVLYFHGGGFTSGSAEIYRNLTARISCSGEIPVLTVDYRLAPEHVYPSANEDCLAAYRWLLAEGFSPGNILLGGDSVGATLVLMTLIALRNQGEELPAGAYLWSPHSDLVNLDGPSYDSNALLDPTGSREGNRRILQDYLGGGYRAEIPAILSPLQLNLDGLPPLFIQAGGDEVLRSDAERLAEQAQQEGVLVTLEIWEEMWSVFQMMAGMLPEAEAALIHTGSFIRTVLDK